MLGSLILYLKGMRRMMLQLFWLLLYVLHMHAMWIYSLCGDSVVLILQTLVAEGTVRCIQAVHVHLGL